MMEKTDLRSELIRRMADVSGEPAAISLVTGEVLQMVSEALIRLRKEHIRFRASDSVILADSSFGMTRKEANAFLCACFLEFRSGKADVWDNVVFFTEEILENPDTVWQEIVHHTREGWNERFYDYNLHPEQVIHDRLYQIATLMVRFYAGDGRQIWTGYEQDPESVYKRLLILKIPRSIACLIVGTLKDLGIVQGPFDIVGDIVDARVLGRMVCGDGSGITPMKARRLARMLSPDDPWKLDRPLYLIGTTWCSPGPKCRACPVKQSCVTALSEGMGIRPDPVIRESFFGKKSYQRTLKQWQNIIPATNDDLILK
ncbi:MAG TPA: hypothetical protein PK024_03180 [Methanospirillum sp.]|uniref:hypothetical protein n=2 Tax=Methanospirillum sp. TaxID=45200 RepID=UPI002B5F6C3F|nr:hypothetical protein [Methanospirillum sp.]HOJ95827.1 hypothetical protein [Methanospirillum sp.]